MLLKEGSQGPDVKEVQKLLGVKESGQYDAATIKAVEKFQRNNGLMVDGMVGNQTWGALHPLTATTDLSEKTYSPSEGLFVNKHHLPRGEYFAGPTPKEYLFLHHTLGWDNPYNTIDGWARDDRGQVGTEFVMGGKSVKGDDRYDGELVQCMPQGAYGWHLGIGATYMALHSVGIELCNFGAAKNGKTYTGRSIPSDQLVKLPQAFKGSKIWHAYSDVQIETLRLFILWIAERDSIDIRDGLIAEIKKNGAKAFGFNQDAFEGKIKGMWTHANVRRTGKSDLFPQPDLIDMLLSL